MREGLYVLREDGRAFQLRLMLVLSTEQASDRSLEEDEPRDSKVF